MLGKIKGKLSGVFSRPLSKAVHTYKLPVVVDQWYCGDTLLSGKVNK